jgi:hypothetical protein
MIRNVPKNVKILVERFSPTQLAQMVIEMQASRDLLARLAEESGEKLQSVNARISTLEAENLMFRARDQWGPAPFDLENDPHIEGDDDSALED